MTALHEYIFVEPHLIENYHTTNEPTFLQYYLHNLEYTKAFEYVTYLHHIYLNLGSTN